MNNRNLADDLAKSQEQPRSRHIERQNENNGDLPECFTITTMQQVIANDGKPPAWILKDLLPVDGLQVLSGRAKSRKSWLALDQCISVAAGLPWLGFQTIRTPSIYVNFELSRRTLEARIKMVADGKKVDLLNLRRWFLPITIDSGKLEVACAKAGLEPDMFTGQVFKQIEWGMEFLELEQDDRAFMTVDSFYNFVNVENDNNAGQVAAVYRLLRNFRRRNKLAMSVIHHFAKGSIADKMSGDLAAGSRVHRQEPNTYIELVPHREAHCYVFQADLRDYIATEPFGLRWDAESRLLVPDPELNVEDIKRPPGRGKSKATHVRQVVMALTQPMSGTDWMLAAMENGEVSRATFYRAKKQLLEAQKVAQKDGKYHVQTR